MNRVEAAIQEGRCVIAVGGRALQNPDVMMELRRRSTIPAVVLGHDPVDPAAAISAASLAPVLDHDGGVLVLVEPEGGQDGKALSDLTQAIQGGKHTPRLVVAARAYNPFSMPIAMRLLKTEQVKQRAQDFLASLPVPSAAIVVEAAVAAPAAPVEEDRHRAARPDLVDRTEELAQLQAWLGEEGGPIVVAGPSGVGRRWLVEAALKDHSGKRLPDLTFARGTGIDALLGRLAIAGKMGGDSSLHDALIGKKSPPPVELAHLVLQLAQGDALDGAVLVLRDLDHLLDRRDGSLYREGRLELVLRALLTHSLKLRVVMVSTLQPELYAEGQAQHIRRLNLRGLPGKELHELFSLWHAPEFERDRFGPISDRTHGHPMAARALAIASRDTPIDELLDQPRYLKALALDDLSALDRHLKRRVEKLDAEQREGLEAAASLHEPGTPEELQVFGLKRDVRIALQAAGLLEQVQTATGRRYYVHPLVRAHLDRRQVEDFGRMESLGMHLLERSRSHRKAGEDAQSIAVAFEANRLLVGARRARSRIKLPYPDLDATLDDLYGLMRRKQPRYDIAHMRVAEALKTEAVVTELLLAQAELLQNEKGGVDEVQALYDKIMAECATPEAAHAEATWHLKRGSRGKAVEALQRGAQYFPENARMRRRLGGLLAEMNQLTDAVDVLKQARDLEPMMPDNYSLLGDLYVQLGQDHWADAATVLQEALELAGEDPQHKVRYAGLLHAQGAADPAVRAAKWEEAEAVARKAYETDPKDDRAALRLVGIILDRVEALDATRLDQAEYILKPVMKSKRPMMEALVLRARVLARKEQWRDADDLLDKALHKAGGMASAFMARAERWEAAHQPFHALEAWKAARERTQPGTAERFLADQHLARMQTLIESGMAAKMMAEKGIEAAPDPQNAGATPKQIQQRVKRRAKAEGEGKAAEGAEEAQGAEGAEEAQAEGAGEESAEHPEIGGVEESAVEAPLASVEEVALSEDAPSEEIADDDTSSDTGKAVPVGPDEGAAPEEGGEEG